MYKIKNKIMDALRRTFIEYRDVKDFEISKKEALEIIKNNTDAYLIDVRSVQEYKEGHLDRAILIPLSEIEQNISIVVHNKNSIIIAYCSVGARSRKAVEKLKKLGYINTYSIRGGLYD